MLFIRKLLERSARQGSGADVESHVAAAIGVAERKISAMWDHDDQARVFLRHGHEKLVCVLLEGLCDPVGKNEALRAFDENKNLLIEIAKRKFGESTAVLACLALGLH